MATNQQYFWAPQYLPPRETEHTTVASALCQRLGRRARASIRPE